MHISFPAVVSWLVYHIFPILMAHNRAPAKRARIYILGFFVLFCTAILWIVTLYSYGPSIREYFLPSQTLVHSAQTVYSTCRLGKQLAWASFRGIFQQYLEGLPGIESGTSCIPNIIIILQLFAENKQQPQQHKLLAVFTHLSGIKIVFSCATPQHIAGKLSSSLLLH